MDGWVLGEVGLPCSPRPAPPVSPGSRRPFPGKQGVATSQSPLGEKLPHAWKAAPLIIPAFYSWVVAGNVFLAG